MSDPSVPPPRQFGFWTAYFLVIASMVGAGILTTSGYTLRETGNPASLIGLWIVGGGMAMCGALTLVELGTRYPHVGGDYVYVREAFGRDAGAVAGWATFVIGFAAPTAVLARLATDYLIAPYLSAENVSPDWISPLGASVIIVLISLTHMRGHHDSARLQTISTVAKLVVLVALTASGLLLGKGSWSHFAVGHWPPSTEWPLLASGLVYVGYAYSGWNGAGYLAGEIERPVQLLPRATIGACLTVIVLYVLVNVMYVFALEPRGMMGRSPDEVGRVAEIAVEAMFGPRAAAVVSTLLGVGVIASVSAYLLAGPRIAVAMARDAAFPAIAARLHPRRRTPVIATVMQAGPAILLAWSSSFLAILDYAAIGLSAISAFVVASVFPLRRRNHEGAVYRLPFYPLPPLIYLGLSLWTVVAALIQPDRRVPSLLALATLLIGVLVVKLMRAKTTSSTNT